MEVSRHMSIDTLRGRGRRKFVPPSCWRIVSLTLRGLACPCRHLPRSDTGKTAGKGAGATLTSLTMEMYNGYRHSYPTRAPGCNQIWFFNDQSRAGRSDRGEAMRRKERCRAIDADGANDDDNANKAWDAIFAHVAELPATTMEGMRAKAAVLLMALQREHEFFSNHEPADTFNPRALMDSQGNRRDAYLAWSLAADLTGGAA